MRDVSLKVPLLLLLLLAVSASALAVVWRWNKTPAAVVADRPPQPAGRPPEDEIGRGEVLVADAARALAASPINGNRAYGYLKQVCAIGPRRSGSEGMTKQQKLLTKHFEQLGGKVSLQKFRYVAYPRIAFANLIVQWHPDAKQRILLCAHYDTRPFPDRDKKNPRGTFIGANDGGSGVAVLMELAHAIHGQRLNVGVDFVLFDAEEYVFDDTRDRYFLGSEWFATKYVATANTRSFKYKWGVLLDMVGDKNLEIYIEKNSFRQAKTRRLVREIWGTAKRLGVREFFPRVKHTIKDDHLALIRVAKIPTCDLIDFDYPHWHTQADTPDKCSASSLGKVGAVMLEWLKTAK